MNVSGSEPVVRQMGVSGRRVRAAGNQKGDGKLDVIAAATNDARSFSCWINEGEGKFSRAYPLP